MLHGLTTKMLWDQRRSISWWIAGMALMAVYTVLLFPTLRESGYADLVADIPPRVRAFLGMAGAADPVSPTGYLQHNLFGLTMPLLFVAYGIAIGARAIAGEEERGGLEVVLALPVSRTKVLVARALGLLAGCLALGIALVVVVNASANSVEMVLRPDGLVAAGLATTLLGLLFGSLALAVGAATGRSSLAVNVAGLLAFAAYVVDSLGTFLPELRPWREMSPLHLAYRSDPLRTGFDPVPMTILGGLTLVVVALSWPAFRRRDVRA